MTTHNLLHSERRSCSHLSFTRSTQTTWVPLLPLEDGRDRYVHRLGDLGSDIVVGCDQASILIPEFISIIWSRQQSTFSLQSFQIWIPSDQQDPLELIDGPWISLEGFGRLANDGAIKGENLLQLMASRLVENMFRPSGKPSAACCQREIRTSHCNRSRHGSWSCPEMT